MTLEEIQSICTRYPFVTQDIKWENHLCFSVGEKMFLITSPDLSPITASFKASEEEFEELIARSGCQPAPYLARYKWVYTDDINRFTLKEWQYYLKGAYEMVKSKLPKKKLKELGLG